VATWRVHLLGECPLERSVVHLGGGHQALDTMGLLGFLFGSMELARGHMGCDSVLARGI
jgi:hypothetical protein